MPSLDVDKIKIAIRNYLIKLTKIAEISDSADLIGSGIIDSMNFIQLILFIESVYKIKIKIFDMRLGDFESINSLSNFIARKWKVPK